MSGGALMLTDKEFATLVAEHIAAMLSPERLEQIAENAIASRIGQLTLDQAARHLQCKSIRQLTDFCREHRIPIEHFGRKKRFILLSEIEAAQKRAKLKVSDPEAPMGTAISPVADGRAA